MTLETFGKIKAAADITSEMLAQRCSEAALSWAKAARKSRDQVMGVHRKIADGYRTPLPWGDEPNRAVPRAPFAHQEIMGTVAAETSGCAFLAEMGTGKTRAAVEAMAHHARAGHIDMCLVIAPVAVTSVWLRECVMWTNLLEPVRLDGPVRQRKEWLAATGRALRAGDYRANRMPVVITNYEVLDKLADTMVSMDIKLGLVLDEGHRIRNPAAKVSKAARRVATVCRWRLLLTGTPILNGLENLWSQWFVVDFGETFGANFVQFRREFFSENRWSHSTDPLDGTVDTFGARLKIRGLRFRKEDCLDLPPKLYEIHEVTMTREQSEAYQQMQNDLIARIEEMEADALEEGRTASASIILVQILRLTQITSGFLPLDDVPAGTPPHRFAGNPKLDACEEIVRERIADGRSVIVWAWYREDVARIEERLADLSPAKIVGGLTHAQREAAEADFQEGRTKLLIANPASAGVGLNLFAASVAIYYSQGYNLEHRAQSEDRCHRSGSEVHDNVTYIDLSCTDTIDEAVREALAGKLALAEAVTEFRGQLGI